uniref:DNA-directed RNA polymerase n=1 Tax=Euglena clara TaxID=215708 RepID=A0A2Z4YUQ6_9EUGL|nr:RNA polymerase beta'' subunit [Euglena clara]AXA45457.1 RNA polymerase beta'' subunit [Euglena clara]
MKLKNIPNFNKTFNKNELKNIISWFLTNYGSLRTTKLIDKLKKIGFKNATTAGISIGIEDLRIPKTKEILLRNSAKILYKNDRRYEQGKTNIISHFEKISLIWNTTNELLKDEILINFRQTDLLNPLYMMTLSGARGNISQIKQLVGMRGLMSDSQGEIINLPIKNNFKEGLNIIEYFISCYGARKGLIDTALKTANSGYLTRRLIYVTQGEIVKKPNCFTKHSNLILIKKNNKKEYKKIKEKLLGRVLAKTIIEKKSGKILVSYGQDICNYTLKKVIGLKKIYIRTPLTCKLNTGICQLCYGWNLANGRIAELGETIGILAAQSIGEPGTQLTMRTFHTGGIFSGEVAKTILAPHKGSIYYNSDKKGKKIFTKYKEKAFLTFCKKKVTIIENTKNKSTIYLPEYTIIYARPKEKIFEKQIIAEVCEYKQKKLKVKTEEVQEIKAKTSGQIINMKKKNKLLWILSGNIISYHKLHENLHNKLFYKELLVKHKRKFYAEKVKVSSVKNKLENEKNIVVNKIKKEKIIKIKENSIQCQIPLGKLLNKERKILTFKNKYSAQIIQKNNNLTWIRKANAYLIEDNKKISNKNSLAIKKNSIISRTYYKKQKTEDIVQGLPKIEELLEAKKTFNLKRIANNPQDKLRDNYESLNKQYYNAIAVRKSIEKLQFYLIRKIQKVYELQGVIISDKHMEIIVKKMTSKVIITDSENSNYIAGETIDINRIEKINIKLHNKIKYEPLLLGITKVSLSNQSFISEACFQETTRVLSRSAIEGKIDWLYGLKENIVLGNLIPAGTGYNKNLNIY